MTKKEAIEQLQSLMAHCSEMAICSEGGFDWKKDVKALSVAIEALKK